jgi:hypothetical protein
MTIEKPVAKEIQEEAIITQPLKEKETASVSQYQYSDTEK